MNIVLYQPEIPQNTGNIARTCGATGTVLHLIKPLGFKIDEKSVKRAGLDYWDLVDIRIYENEEEFFNLNKDREMYFVSTKGKKNYSEINYNDDTLIIFGKETSGLPNWIHQKYKDKMIKIPMVDIEKARSLNLSNAVAIVLYEGLKQNNFVDLI